MKPSMSSRFHASCCAWRTARIWSVVEGAANAGMFAAARKITAKMKTGINRTIDNSFSARQALVEFAEDSAVIRFRHKPCHPERKRGTPQSRSEERRVGKECRS